MKTEKTEAQITKYDFAKIPELTKINAQSSQLDQNYQSIHDEQSRIEKYRQKNPHRTDASWESEGELFAEYYLRVNDWVNQLDNFQKSWTDTLKNQPQLAKKILGGKNEMVLYHTNQNQVLKGLDLSLIKLVKNPPGLELQTINPNDLRTLLLKLYNEKEDINYTIARFLPYISILTDVNDALESSSRGDFKEAGKSLAWAGVGLVGSGEFGKQFAKGVLRKMSVNAVLTGLETVDISNNFAYHKTIIYKK